MIKFGDGGMGMQKFNIIGRILSFNLLGQNMKAD